MLQFTGLIYDYDLGALFYITPEQKFEYRSVVGFGGGGGFLTHTSSKVCYRIRRLL